MRLFTLSTDTVVPPLSRTGEEIAYHACAFSVALGQSVTKLLNTVPHREVWYAAKLPHGTRTVTDWGTLRNVLGSPKPEYNCKLGGTVALDTISTKAVQSAKA